MKKFAENIFMNLYTAVYSTIVLATLIYAKKMVCVWLGGYKLEHRNVGGEVPPKSIG